MRGRLRRGIASLLLLGVSSLAALLLVEAIFRQTAHRVAADGEWLGVGRIMDDEDPILGFSLIPGGTQLSVRGGAYVWRARVNGLGMHDVPRDARAPSPGAARRRILVLGDSFTFGPGVPIERNFTQVLERGLDGTEVLNAAVPGYSAAQHYLYYRHRGRLLGADLVLVAFFVNDLTQANGMALEEDEAGLPVAVRREKRRGAASPELRGSAAARRGLSDWLRDRSLLYEFARIRTRRLGAGTRPAREETFEARAARTPEAVAFRDPDADERAREAWRRGLRTLDALEQEIRRSGARLALVVVPAPFQLSEAVWSKWVAWLGAPAGSMDRAMPQRVLGAWCERSGIPFLDLAGPLARAGGERLYIPHDLHWNAEGHAAAAAALLPFVGSELRSTEAP